MSSQSKVVVIAVLAAAVLIVFAYLGRDLYLKRPHPIKCDDGLRQTIDLRSFTNDYWAYSMEFEAALTKEKKLTARLDPRQLQQLSESLQQAMEFRKYVVAGYNSCAISKKQYGEFGSRFYTLDAVSRQITALTQKTELTHEEQKRLATLVDKYANMVGELAR
jgi:hypothetical protein